MKQAIFALLLFCSQTIFAWEVTEQSHSPQDADNSELLQDVIFNGKEVLPQERVGQVTVRLVEIVKSGPFKGKVVQEFCSGTIIDAEFVVTAGHCVATYKGETSEKNIELAVQYRALNSQKMITVKVKKLVVHPKYLREQQEFDVAVLQLASSIKDRRPMSLAVRDDYRNQDRLTVAGFGLNHLGKGDLSSDPIILKLNEDIKNVDDPESTKGKSQIAALRAKIAQRGTELGLFNRPLLKYQSESMLFDADGMQILTIHSTTSGICKGDSGGPSFLEKNGRLVLVGIHSFGDALNCKPKQNFFAELFQSRKPTFLGFDVFVPFVRDWIQSTKLQLQAQKDI